MRRGLLTTIASLSISAAAAAQPLTVFTDFEGIFSTDFVIGTSPVTAHFTGGESTSVGNFAFYHSGLFSWMVWDGGTTGTIDFETPASRVEFWARDSGAAVDGLIEVFNIEGEVVATNDVTTTFTLYQYVGVGPIARIELTNTTGGIGSSAIIDDFGFDPIEPLADPIPETINQGEVRIELEEIATDLTSPVLMIDAGDGSGRLFIVEQHGVVLLLNNGKIQPTPFLDITSRIVTLGVFGTQNPLTDFDERGLLGLAFHPDFATPAAPGEGKLYTYSSELVAGPADFTTASPPPAGRVFDHQSIITEWTVDANNPDIVDPTSRRELIRIDEPQFNHNSGMVAFGPDGMLYVTIGDGGGADDEDDSDFFGMPLFGHGPLGNGQNHTTILGSIIRIDPLGSNSANGQYGVPQDNPWVGIPGLDEFYAIGLRNAFRFSFDSLTGALVLADVGQNDIEEINVVQAGDNLGWRLKEGSFRFIPNGTEDGFVIADTGGLSAALADPIAEFDHDEGISVIGGYVYRGSQLPALDGLYVFGDFSLQFAVPNGRLFYTDLVNGEIKEFILGNHNRTLDLFVKGFGQDADGEVYLMAGTNLGPFGNLGGVFKFVDVCFADCEMSTGRGVLDLFDFLCFQNSFVAGESYACDCDTSTGSGVCDLFDFLCFQNAFVSGCQ